MRRDPPTIHWAGTVFRATTYDVPLWVLANRRAGRWNHPGRESTQYACLDPEAPFAETIRGEDLRTEALAASYRTVLWQLRIDEGAIVDYSTFEKAEAAGFPADALVHDDRERCRVEADRLRALGMGGVLSPSAALPRSINLTLFGPRVPVDWETRRMLASMIPVRRLSAGNAPPGLVGRTRFYGMAHSGLQAHQAAQRPLFELPPERKHREQR